MHCSLAAPGKERIVNSPKIQKERIVNSPESRKSECQMPCIPEVIYAAPSLSLSAQKDTFVNAV